MSLRIVLLRGAADQPWANGGGRTRELLAWSPAGEAPWRVRVSVASIESDGPFSRLPGVRRWFAVLSGAGVRLRFARHELVLAPGDPPIEFDGAEAPQCGLVDGTTADLNLMVRGGSGKMTAVRAGATYLPVLAQSGLYAVRPGTLRAGAQAPIEVPAQALAWDDAPAAGAAWRFEARPAPAPAGYWLEAGL